MDNFAELELTPREREIVNLAKSGMQIRSMAAALFVTQSSIKNHLTNIFRKFGVKSRFELIAEIHRRTPVPVPLVAVETSIDLPAPSADDLIPGLQPRLTWYEK